MKRMLMLFLIICNVVAVSNVKSVTVILGLNKELHLFNSPGLVEALQALKQLDHDWWSGITEIARTLEQHIATRDSNNEKIRVLINEVIHKAESMPEIQSSSTKSLNPLSQSFELLKQFNEDQVSTTYEILGLKKVIGELETQQVELLTTRLQEFNAAMLGRLETLLKLEYFLSNPGRSAETQKVFKKLAEEYEAFLIAHQKNYSAGNAAALQKELQSSIRYTRLWQFARGLSTTTGCTAAVQLCMTIAVKLSLLSSLRSNTSKGFYAGALFGSNLMAYLFTDEIFGKDLPNDLPKFLSYALGAYVALHAMSHYRVL